jgi:ribose transport system substrate-binding protein
MAPPRFAPPGPAFDAAKARGKTVYVIAAGVNVPFIADVDKGISDGLAAVGVTTKVFDGQVNPALVTQYLQQAVAQKASLIINQTLPSSVITAPLARVKAAGIPVVQMFERDPGPLPAAMAARGIMAQANECSACAGKLMADWAIMHTGGKVDAVGLDQSGVTYGKVETGAIEQELAKCGCHVKWVDAVSAEDWATKVPTLTNSALLDPKVNTLFPVYDNMATYMIPPIKQHHAQSRVTISTYNANGNILAGVKAGTVGVDMGQSAVWLGWSAADQALRVLSGVTPLVDEKVPLRLFDQANINSVNTAAPQASWFKVDFADGYKKLWGVG